MCTIVCQPVFAHTDTPMMENFAKKRCRLGLYLDNVRHIRIRDVKLENEIGDKLIADHYETLETEDF